MAKTKRYDFRERGGVEKHLQKRGKKQKDQELQEEEFDANAWSELNYDDTDDEEEYCW